ncbi:hypothetical protein KA005_64805 [bacterium]|nr:hypothetical protein [bacterium]
MKKKEGKEPFRLHARFGHDSVISVPCPLGFDEASPPAGKTETVSKSNSKLQEKKNEKQRVDFINLKV